MNELNNKIIEWIKQQITIMDEWIGLSTFSIINESARSLGNMMEELGWNPSSIRNKWTCYHTFNNELAIQTEELAKRPFSTMNEGRV